MILPELIDCLQIGWVKPRIRLTIHKKYGILQLVDGTEEKHLKNQKECVIMKISKNKMVMYLVLSMLLIGTITISAVGYITNVKNEENLKTLMNQFTHIISESVNGDIVEAKSVYGKLNGNGNGIQYFGIVLIDNASVNNIEHLIAELDDQFEIVEYFEQSESEIDSKYLEHKKLEYDTQIRKDGKYISIYFYNSINPESDLRDVMGN